MKPYPHYKASGVPWLGDVPAHWDIRLLKHIAEVRSGIAKGKKHDGDELICMPYLRVANVQDGSLDLDNVAELEVTSAEARRYTLQAGDVLMNEGGDFDKLGRGAVWNEQISPCLHQNHVFAVRPFDRRLSSWIAAVSATAYAKFYFMANAKQSTNLASISQSDIRLLPVLIPPRQERKAILENLMDETQRIDMLIAEKEDLVETLHELRQAVIVEQLDSLANTNHGNPSRRFPWLKAVPSDWDVCKLKHVVSSFDQGISPQCESRLPEEGEWGVLKVGCVNTGTFDPMESKALPSEIPPLAELTLSKNDVMVSRANTRDLVGRAALADRDYPRLMLSDKLYRLRLDTDRCDPAFLVQLLALPPYRAKIQQRATGASASMVNIDQRTILELDLALPPLTAQRQLIANVHQEQKAIAALVEHAKAEITLLQELRAATITEAVLGRVQVAGSAVAA